MTQSPTARATARRNVAERIDRFLTGLDRARRLPNRRELFWLRTALVDLQEGQYPTGEDAMDKAERRCGRRSGQWSRGCGRWRAL